MGQEQVRRSEGTPRPVGGALDAARGQAELSGRLTAWPLLVDAAIALLAAALLLFWSPMRGHGAPSGAPANLVAALLLPARR